MQNELKELEEITKEYFNKINALLEKAYTKANITEAIEDIIKPLENISYISTIHDIETARHKVWEILSSIGKFNIIKKYNFTQQEIRILLILDIYNDNDNITDLLQSELSISKYTVETHIKNIANKITDILMPYIDCEDEFIEISENNNVKNPKFVIKQFLSELWHYLE